MGRISNIQRMCSHDGPGIRTTAFLKGCPLRCSWCHNPENIHPQSENAWNAQKCIGCGECIRACPQHAIAADENGLHIDREHCRHCGSCAQACPAKAMQWYGREYTPEELCRELFKDRTYYKNSGGGITLSGGEPLAQPDFTANVLRICRENGINTAVDTSCYAREDIALQIAGLADIMLIDIKHIDPAAHRQLTGVDNAPILQNICKIAALSRSRGKPDIYIRTPLVPGCTLSEENIRGIGAFLKENLADVLVRWELLLFHNMCAVKYRELDIEWKHAATRPVNHEQLLRIRSLCGNVGLRESQVQVSGLVMD